MLEYIKKMHGPMKVKKKVRKNSDIFCQASSLQQEPQREDTQRKGRNSSRRVFPFRFVLSAAGFSAFR